MGDRESEGGRNRGGNGGGGGERQEDVGGAKENKEKWRIGQVAKSGTEFRRNLIHVVSGGGRGGKKEIRSDQIRGDQMKHETVTINSPWSRRPKVHYEIQNEKVGDQNRFSTFSG